MLDATTRALVDLALAEDLGPGDLTSRLLPTDRRGEAVLIAKSALVFSGAEVLRAVFERVDPTIAVEQRAPDGAELAPGEVAARVEGPVRRLLEAERTALNFVQRLSGVATLTHAAVRKLHGTSTRVVDTRKTTPGFRVLEKAAVRHGGGTNHRFGLFDGVLIKDNHVDAAGGIGAAIEAARRAAHHLVKIECEVRTLEELDQALESGADVVLLDNMDAAAMTEAVRRNRTCAKPALLEASGNVTLDRLPEIAATGVDLVSMGALTHSAPAADLSLKFVGDGG